MTAPEDAATDVMPRVLSTPKPRESGGKVETGLIAALLVLLGALSIVRLTTRGVESGAFADADVLGLSWVTPLLLALLWAVAIDWIIYTAIWIIRRDPANPAAWALLLIFAFFNVWSQAHGPEPWMVMATAPVAVVLVVAARHLVPVLRDARDRRRLADDEMNRILARPNIFEPHREVAGPHRESSPPVAIHNHIHNLTASSAQAAALTTPPHDRETGEEVTGEAEGDPPTVTTPHREEVSPHRQTTREVTPAVLTTSPRVLTASPPHREVTAPPVPAYSSVEEAWEEIVVRGGGRLGWRKAMTLTGVTEYRAKTELGRLTTQET